MENNNELDGMNSSPGTGETIDVRTFLQSAAEDNVWSFIGDLTFDGDEGEEAGNEDTAAHLNSADYAEVPVDPHAQEQAIAALESVTRLTKGRTKKSASYVRTVSEEDFEDGSERFAFKLIKANVSGLFDSKLKPALLIEAANWVFGRVIDPFSFEECCRTLGVRSDVVRLRVQYQFWKTWRTFPIEFPFSVVPVPEIVEGEIYIVAGEVGYDIAKAAWMQPGISTKSMLTTACGGEPTPEYQRALELLSEKYILSNHRDSWWLTGRNPTLRDIDMANSVYRRVVNQVSWSKLF